MPIRCRCPNGHTLKAPEALAGSESACPQCGEKVQIPNLEKPTTPQPQSQPQPQAQNESTPPPLPSKVAAESAVEWRLASPEGQQYGPTVETLFAKWITDGRVKPDWLVWRTGWPEWKTAAEAEADLPAPLLIQPTETSEASAPPVPPTSPVSEPAKETSAKGAKSDGYLDRRRRAAQRRKLMAILLAIAVIVMLGVLAWLIQNPSQS